MSMLRAALPYTAGDRRQALEILLQADALLSTARKNPVDDLEACDTEPNPEEMLLHMQEFCTPRESDFIQMMLNFIKAGHLFQNYREFLASHNHTGPSGEAWSSGFSGNTSNPLHILLQMLGGFGGSGNLMEFLLTQLSPEQKQMFEQFGNFAPAGAPPAEEEAS